MDSTYPARSDGDDITAQRLRREHGADLARLAAALLDDGGEAATVIVEAVIAEVLDGSTRHGLAPTRSDLAERVHRRCRSTSPTHHDPVSGAASYAALVGRHQGAATALYVHGHLSPQRIAHLLNLGPRGVCLLLLHDLDSLAERDRRPTARHHAW